MYFTVTRVPIVEHSFLLSTHTVSFYVFTGPRCEGFRRISLPGMTEIQKACLRSTDAGATVFNWYHGSSVRRECCPFPSSLSVVGLNSITIVMVNYRHSSDIEFGGTRSNIALSSPPPLGKSEKLKFRSHRFH